MARQLHNQVQESGEVHSCLPFGQAPARQGILGAKARHSSSSPLRGPLLSWQSAWALTPQLQEIQGQPVRSGLTFRGSSALQGSLHGH